MPWRNDHWYRAEPLEFRRLRHHDNIDLNHAAADETLPSDLADRFDPATDQWPTSLHEPIPLLSSCRTAPAPCGESNPAPAGPRNQLQRAARPGDGAPPQLGGSVMQTIKSGVEMLKEQYRKGLTDGVEMTINQIDGTGALLPGSTYGGPIPPELAEWISSIRDMLAIEAEHRS